LRAMESKERIQASLQSQKVDRVPVSPDVSVQVPIAYAGKIFWEVLLGEKPPLWKLQLELSEEFGFDLILHTTMVNIFQERPEDPKQKVRIVSKREKYVASRENY